MPDRIYTDLGSNPTSKGLSHFQAQLLPPESLVGAILKSMLLTFLIPVPCPWPQAMAAAQGQLGKDMCSAAQGPLVMRGLQPGPRSLPQLPASAPQGPLLCAKEILST